MTLSISNIGDQPFSSSDELLIQQINNLFQGAPDPETVFAKFDELTSDLIAHDRIVIGFYAKGWSQSEIAYAAGTPVENYTTGTRNNLPPNDMEIWSGNRRPVTDQTADAGLDGRLMSEFNQETRQHGFLSWLLAPIVWNGEVIGNLLFRSMDEGAYQDREISLAEILAENIAATVSGAQATSEAQVESNLRKDLLELSRIVSSAKSLQSIPAEFGNIILSITNSDRATVSLPNRSGNSAENILVFGESVPDFGVGGQSPEIGTDSITWMKAATAYVIDEKVIAESELNRWSEESAAEAGFHSAMVAPILWQGSSIAAITFRSRAQHHYNSSHLDIANAIANQIAGAVASQIAHQETLEQSQIRDLLARIGRVITASQDLDETFDELAELMTQLIPSERISLITNQRGTDRAMARHSYGRELFNLAPGDIPGDDNQLNAVIMRTRSPFVVDSNVPGIEKALMESHRLADPVDLAGWMIAPLFWRDECIGSLHFRSEQPDAYTSSELQLADEIATQISGIVAGTVAYKELLKEAKEREALSNISRATTSSNNLNETFSRLSESISKLIPWDRIAITTLDLNGEGKNFIYQAGIEYDSEALNTFPFDIKDQIKIFEADPTPIFVGEELETQFPVLKRAADLARTVGLNSWLLAPLFWRNEQIGHIHFRATGIESYDASHIRYASQISDHVSGAIAGILANDQLAKQVIERDVLTEISRAITASQDIDEAIGPFAQSVSQLIPWDRIAIVALQAPGLPRDFTFQDGVAYNGYQPDKLPFENKELFTSFADDPTPIIVGEDLISSSKPFRAAQNLADSVGLNSWLLAPLVWHGAQIGHMHFRSKEHEAYDDSHIRLAALVSDQISGAIASHIANIQMSKEALVRNVLAELGRVIAASDDFGVALSEIERLSSEMIEFNGFSIGSYNAERRTVRRVFARGLFLLEDASPEEFPIDESAASTAIQSGKPIRQEFTSVEQLSDFPRSIEAFNAGSRAFLTAPLISNDEIVGVMQFRSSSANAFSRVEVENSQRLADQIAGALANSLANERIRLQATALESADNAIFITSPKGVIEWTNSAFSRLSGWSPSEVVGFPTSVMKSTDPKNWSRDADIWNALDSGMSWSGTHINRKKDGTEYPEELTVTPVLDQDGNVNHIVGIKRDITERLLAEEAHDNSLRIESENRELQRLASARSEFLSTVSHELRTPLTTVSAFADILFNSRSENLTERQREHIELIRKSSTQLGSLIDDLLDISQADTGHLVLNKAVFNIADMIDEVAGNSAVLFTHRDQKFKVKNKAKKHGLLGDRSRVIQILTNLLTNASKFSDKGSTIGFQVEIKREQIVFTVKDRGAGISKSDQAMMFSPFFRGTGDSSSRPDGRGLGLAVVRSLVDLHDGSIVVNSKSGKGTEIVVTLPGVTPNPPED